MTNNTLKKYAQRLRLSGLLSTLELRLKEAEASRLPYHQFLELVFQDELNVREQRTIARRQKAADFREIRSLDNFDFAFNPSIDRARIYELAACHFIRQQRDALLVGPPGVGKSHLFKPSELKRSGPASWCSTARCSTWCANSPWRPPRLVRAVCWEIPQARSAYH